MALQWIASGSEYVLEIWIQAEKSNKICNLSPDFV